MKTKDKIKSTAQELFAEKGVDGVAVRDIVKAAGLKNQGSLHYYFGTKEELIRELIVDGARLIDERRNTVLSQMETLGGPQSIRQVADVLVFPSTGLIDDRPFESSYTRFIVLVQQSHPGVFMRALDNQWNSGYQRCLTHFRNLLPGVPDIIKSQRFIFIGAMLGSVLSIREKVIVNNLKGVKKWSSDETLNHLSQIVSVILEAPLDETGFSGEVQLAQQESSWKRFSGSYEVISD